MGTIGIGLILEEEVHDDAEEVLQDDIGNHSQ